MSLSEFESNHIEWRTQAIAEEAAKAREAQTAPHVLMRPAIYPDGNAWCALYGENLQEGVCGFGDTPAEACADFDKNWREQRLMVGQSKAGAA